MRETGPIRRQAELAPGTDPAAVAPYVGLARVLLGQLKNRMLQGGLSQLARTYQLPDGTQVMVASRHGQDTVRIVPPRGVVVVGAAPELSVPASPPDSVLTLPEPPTLSLTIPGSMIIVGESDDQVNGWKLGVNSIGHSVRWSANGAITDLGYPASMVLAGATGISADGSVIVGSANDNQPHRTNIGWRWTAGGGFKSLGGLGLGYWGTVNTFATGVSADGQTVVGYSTTDSNIIAPFVWTPKGGMVGLPHLGSGGQAWGIAPLGHYVAGTVLIPGTNNTQACLWKDGQLQLLGAPSPTNGVGYTNDARAVSDTGVAVGSTTRDGNTLAACSWASGQQVVLSSYTWPGSAAHGITPDGKVIVGSVKGGFSTNAAANWGGGAAGNSAAAGTTAFFWTAKTGVVSLGPGSATAVTADGVFIVGATVNLSDGSGANNGIAVWNRSTGAQRIFPNLGSGFSSFPTAVTIPPTQTLTVPPN